MAVMRRLPQSFETHELRCLPIGPGECFLMHRFPGDGHDIYNPDCWCGPIVWTYEQTRQMPLRDMQRRMDEFLSVH